MNFYLVTRPAGAARVAASRVSVVGALQRGAKRGFALVVSCFVWLVTSVWDLIAAIGGPAPGPTCVVLYYHSVSARQRARFSRQMDLLIRWTRPVEARNDTWRHSSGGRFAAVTFDDGFVNVATEALPELSRRQIPVTVFVASGLVGDVPSWADVYADETGPPRVMDLRELRFMASSPRVTIGSHTVTHPDLTTMDRTEARRELSASRRQLEAWLGVAVDVFSFPYGAFNLELIERCREVGYSAVFTTVPGVRTRSSDSYTIERVPASASDWEAEFVLKLLGAYRWLPYAIAAKRTLLGAFRSLV